MSNKTINGTKDAARKEIDDAVAMLTPPGVRSQGEWRLEMFACDNVPADERTYAFQSAQAAADSVLAPVNCYGTSVSVRVSDPTPSDAREYIDENEEPREAPLTYEAELIMRNLPGWRESITAESSFLSCLEFSVGREVYTDIVKFQGNTLYVRALFRVAKGSKADQDHNKSEKAKAKTKSKSKSKSRSKAKVKKGGAK